MRVATICLFWAAAAQAQVETGRATIIGRVNIAGDTMPMAGAEVVVEGSRERATTDVHGGFKFTGIYPGRYEVRVRRLGYEQLVKMVTVAGGETSRNVWEMHQVPQHLSEVRVNGRTVSVPMYLQDAYRRAATGFGDYLLPDEIERRNAYSTRELFDMVPGARVSDNIYEPSPVQFARCNGHENPSGQGAAIQVYIDGHRVTRMMNEQDALNSVTPRDIELVEVYRGTARIPGEFLEDACAVIVIWTKRGAASTH
jgi:hypothetical protein